MNGRCALLAAAVACVAAAGVAAGLAHATHQARNGLIAFVNAAPGRIWVGAADGTGLRKLTTEKGKFDDWDPQWSPDGSSVVYDRCADKCQVWTVRSDGSGSRLVSPASEDDGEAAWSPDGKRFAYSRWIGVVKGDYPEHSEIWTMNATGTGRRSLTSVTDAAPFSASVEYPSWSPDGTQLVFAVHDSKTGANPNAWALFIVGSDGGDPRQLTPWALNAGGKSDWAPDGTAILFKAISRVHKEHGNLYTIHPDGTGLKQLTHYPEPKTLNAGSFSPDGKWIVMSRFTGTPYPDIYVMRADGSGARPLKTGKAAFAPDWGPAR